jgi:hypothetical protein
MNHVGFTAAPAIGTVIYLDGQRYELISTRPTRRKDGTPTTLLTWSSECPRCGNPFMLTTGLVTKSLNRRCEPCRARAHRPVSGKRRSVPVSVRILDGGRP